MMPFFDARSARVHGETISTAMDRSRLELM
jgi:hypothetical protein